MLPTEVPSSKNMQNAELSMAVGLFHKIGFLSVILRREIFAWRQGFFAFLTIFSVFILACSRTGRIIRPVLELSFDRSRVLGLHKNTGCFAVKKTWLFLQCRLMWLAPFRKQTTRAIIGHLILAVMAKIMYMYLKSTIFCFTWIEGTQM